LIVTLVYYLAFIILGLTTAASGPSLPKLAEHTASGLDRISLIFVFSSLGYLAGSFLGGRAYDRFPGHKLMSLTLIVIGIASLLIPISRSMSLLLFAMALSGLASGILDVGCNTLLLWTHGEKSGPFLNGLHFFFGVGSLTAPLVLAQVLLRTDDIHWLYYSFIIVSVPIAIWLWLLPEPPHSMHEDQQTNIAFPVVPVALIVMLFLLYVCTYPRAGNDGQRGISHVGVLGFVHIWQITWRLDLHPYAPTDDSVHGLDRLCHRRHDHHPVERLGSSAMGGNVWPGTLYGIHFPYLHDVS
jgi:FHS family Na+ dependent glucose MFS transporter 1